MNPVITTKKESKQFTIESKVKVNPKEIPDDVFDAACRILKTAVRRFFEMPGVKEDYEKWLAEYEKEQKLKGGNKGESHYYN